MSSSPQEKYRFKPFLGSSHAWALTQMAALPNLAAVLDVGIGSAGMAQELKRMGFAYLFGVETDERALKHGAPFYKEVAADISHFSDQQFDAILLLDVLEHVSTPEEFFAQIMKMASPNSTILISVPNITHWSVRLMMVFGYFKYMNRGILDRTHLQFFTVKRLRRLIANYPNLRATHLKGSIVPLELIIPESVSSNLLFKWFSALRKYVADLFPSLFGYQLLMEVKVADPASVRSLPKLHAAIHS